MKRAYPLLDLIEQHKLENILETFSKATGIAAIITNVDGSPITKPFNFTKLCSKFCRSTHKGRKLCYQSDSYGGHESARTRCNTIYQCLNAGLTDSASPIFLDDHHIANILCGQILTEPLDPGVAAQRARLIGIKDVEGYLEAVSQISIIPLERFQSIVELMHVVTQTISDLAYQKQQLLRRSRRYLDKIINSVTDGIVSINSEGIITLTNEACKDIFGVEKNHLVGRPFASLLADTASVDELEHNLRNCAQSRGNFKIKVRCGFGNKVLPILLSIATLRTEKEENAGYVGVLRDVSEEERTERMKEDLTGMMTHDLKNPMISIQKALELLAAEQLGSLNNSQKEILDLSLQTGNQLYGMVTDFLDTYRHENGQFRLRKIECNLQSLIQESLAQVDLFAQEKQVRFQRQGATPSTVLQVDFNRIRRTMVNLLENAVKYSPAMGTITVSEDRLFGKTLFHPSFSLPKNCLQRIDPDRFYLLVAVEDQGFGIPEEDTPYIFDKFFTTRQRNKSERKGLGLGLAFCKLAVEAHRGAIWVKTPLNRESSMRYRGCRFSFVLPI
ncbi:PocR ligand-binding domain-containing protein [Desulfobulbus rhabdoformis]|uniref:PocR ligand-binding domain-containing protein n=1 Tax=Desulfobulbus rhabdoformis TaxID=34032 RepID=UPI001963C990|nr:PocR ligand-binding domain-containing protein [Desulfobulbus rhabdoformis]MBM9615128.1 PocR ligand-binding domain-containing protein [Desulfobulbus rhabdoformis]